MNELFDPRQLRTVHAVPLTAFAPSGRINREVQGEHIARLAAAGFSAFLPGAGTSEFHSLTADEQVGLIRITREAAGPEALIFAPLGYQLEHSIEVASRAMEAGATGLMFMPFAHPYMSDAGAREYYREVMERVPAPTLIYKKAAIPSDTLLLELAEHPHIVGVKYAENQLDRFRRVVLADHGRIEWICGSAERFAPFFMLAGATGFTSGAANVCPHIALAMHAALAAGEYEEGLRLQQLLLPIEEFRARDGDSFNVSMLKHAMTRLGCDFGPARPPGRPLTDADRAEINALVDPILAAESELRHELASVGLSRD